MPCVLALMPLCVAAADAPFSLEESLRAHASLDLRLGDGHSLTSANGEYVAWIEDDGLYAARAPRFEARKLAVSEPDAPITAAFASTDGNTLLFVRGTVQPAFGPYAAEDRRELWRVDSAGGTPQQLAKGSEVPTGPLVFAPDGRSFVTADGAMLYEHRLSDAGIERRPLLGSDPQHYAARRLSSFAYSPDGKKLAFVSWRKAKQSYVGIYDFISGGHRYIDPGIFRDVSPAWSPDSRAVVFARVPSNWTMNYRFSDTSAGVPWSLMVADATTSAVRTLWQADRGAGSVYRPFGVGAWMEPDIETASLFWTRSGRILFPWEKSGWLRLYSVAAEGGRAMLLTPGDGEVTLPSLSRDGAQLLYASNIGDIARLHLWRLSVEEGTPQLLTRGGGVEHSPRFLRNGHYVYVGNVEGRMPNRRMVSISTGRQKVLTPRAEDAARDKALWQRFVDSEVLPVRAEDGLTSYHLMMVPKHRPPPGGFPVIVASKGGPNGRVSPGNGTYPALGQYAVSRGYIFVDINYRGCFGFGLDYRLPAGRGATGGSEVRDLEALARHLVGRPDVNPRRIGIMGGSYGGHLVGLALSRLPQYYAAGAHMAGVSDWIVEMNKDQESLRAGSQDTSAPPPFIRLSERARIEDLAFGASPSSRMAAWKAPTLITMGELDLDGHMESIIDLGYRLLEQGTHVEFSVAPEAGHSGMRSRPLDKVFEFFDRTLR